MTFRLLFFTAAVAVWFIMIATQSYATAYMFHSSQSANGTAEAYVDGPNGSDKNACSSPDDSCATLQRGLDALALSQATEVILHIAPGRYTVNETLDVHTLSGKHLTLLGAADSSSVTITGSIHKENSYFLDLQDGEYDVTFRNIAMKKFQAGVVASRQSAPYVTVRINNCQFESIVSYTIGAAFFFESTSTVSFSIESSTFVDISPALVRASASEVIGYSYRFDIVDSVFMEIDPYVSNEGLVFDGSFGALQLHVERSKFSGHALSVFRTSVRGELQADISIKQSEFGNMFSALNVDGSIIRITTSQRSSTRLVLDECVFSANVGASGKAMHVTVGFGTVFSSSIINSTFDGNVAKNGQQTQGGAIMIEGAGSLLVQGSVFRGCRSKLTGGAISLHGVQSLRVEDSLFSSNTCEEGSGGAISVMGANDVTITNTTFVEQRAAEAGAVAVKNAAALNITASTFAYNQALESGAGALLIFNVFAFDDESARLMMSKGVRLSGVVFQHNSAAGTGGALSCSGQYLLHIDNCSFDDNSATDGGGAIAMSGFSTQFLGMGWTEPGVVLERVSAKHNSADGQKGGGAILVLSRDVMLSVRSSNFESNNAFHGNGGDANIMNSKLFVSNSTFRSSRSAANGGCLALDTLETQLDNIVMKQCTARNSGGGVYSSQSASILQMHLITIEGCFAETENGGGVSCQTNEICAIGSSILSNNRAPFGMGGSVYCEESACLIQECQITESQAETGAAAALVHWHDVSSISQSTFGNNNASMQGGHLFLRGDCWSSKRNLRIEHSSFQIGVARYGGAVSFGQNTGVLGCRPGDSIIQRHNTFDNNYAKIAGGTFFTRWIDSILGIDWLESARESSAGHWGPYVASVMTGAVVSEPYRITSGQSAHLQYYLLDAYNQNISHYVSIDSPVDGRFNLSSSNGNVSLVASKGDRQEAYIQFEAIAKASSAIMFVQGRRPQAVDTNFTLSVRYCNVPCPWFEIAQLPVTIMPCRTASQQAIEEGFVRCDPLVCPLTGTTHPVKLSSVTIISYVAVGSMGLHVIVSYFAGLILFGKRIGGTARLWRIKLASITAEALKSGLLAALLVLIALSADFEANNQQSGQDNPFSAPIRIIVYVLCSFFATNTMLLCFLYMEATGLMQPIFEKVSCWNGRITARPIVYILTLFLTGMLASLFGASILTYSFYSDASIPVPQLGLGLIPVAIGAATAVGQLVFALLFYFIVLLRRRPWKKMSAMVIHVQRLLTVLRATPYFIHAILIFLSATVFEILVLLPITLQPLCVKEILLGGLSVFMLLRVFAPISVVQLHAFAPPQNGSQTSRDEKDKEFLELAQLIADGQLDASKLSEFIPKHLRIDSSSLSFGEEIGHGAQGVVFRGVYDSADVAIKSIAPKKFGSTGDISGLFTELSLLSEITHPHIIRLHGCCFDGQRNRFSLVMDLARESLSEFIERVNLSNQGENKLTFSFADKIRLLYGIASGMQYLHKRNLMHRDLKPENVLLVGENPTSPGRPVIVDFGLAKYVNVSAQNATMAVGTASYIAPEVLRASLTEGMLTSSEMVSLSSTSGSSLGSWNGLHRIASALFTSRQIRAIQDSSHADEDEGHEDHPILQNVEGIELRQSKAASTGNSASALASKGKKIRIRGHGKRRAKYSKTCDIYSFGIVMYSVLTENIYPFGKQSDLVLIQRLQNEPTYRPSLDHDLVRNVIENNNRWFIDLMQRCWQVEADERPSFDQIVKQLKQKLQQ